MGVITKKQVIQHSYARIKTLSVVSMMVALATASVSTIWALYLDSYFQSQVIVGLFSAFLTLIAFVSYFIFIPLIEKNDKAKLYMLSLILFVIFYLLFTINLNIVFMIILASVMTALISLRVTSYGILVKDNSTRQDLSRNEGFVYTLLNVAFVVGPLLAGYIASRFGLQYVFLISSLFMLIGLIMFRHSKFTDTKGKKHVDKHPIRNFKDFFKNKHRVIAYFIGSGIQLWWVLIYLFVPLHMMRSGLSEFAVGIFLFAAAFPLIVLEFYFSKKAGRIGFKKIFKFGYIIVAVMSVAAFFFSMNLYIALSFLVLASIGMAMLEPTTQAYFFDILKGKEEYRFYGPYNTSTDTGGLIGRILGSVLLIFLPFQFIYLLFGLLMFLIFLLSFKARAVNESKRKL